MEKEIGAFERYLRRRYPGSSTTKHYISDLRIFRRLIQKPWHEVTRLDIDRFVEDQLARGLSATTVNRRLACLHHFFEFAIDECGDDNQANPLVWRWHRVKEGKALPRDVKDADVERLFACIRHSRDRLMFRLMSEVGLRVGEVARLQVSDLVRGRQAGEGARLRVRGKGQKERVVPLTVDLVQQWDEWLAQRPQVVTGAVFVTRRRQGITVRGIQERLSHYGHQAGVQFTCHQLRHTFGRRMAEMEMPLPSLSKVMGHAQVTTTQVYIAGAAMDVRADYEAAMGSLEAQRTSFVPPPALPPEPKGRDIDDGRWGGDSGDRDEAAMDVSRYWVDLPAWLTGPLGDYIACQQRHWNPSQVRHHTRVRLQTLGQVWRWLLTRGVSSFEALRRQDVQAYVDARLTAGRAASTVNRELRELWSFLRFVEDQGQAVSPGVFRITRLKESKPLPRYLDEETYQRLEMHLLAETQQGSYDAYLDRTWFYLLAHGGLRLGELCDLRLGDLDLVGRRLAVREGKGRRDRAVPLSTTTCQMLNHYLAVRGSSHTDHLLIFRQKKMNPDLVRNRLQRYGAAVGVEVSPHRLRHTLATRLVNVGMDIVAIQRLLGHEKLETTMIYARVHDATMEHDFRQALARLEGDRQPWPMPAQPEPYSLAEELFSHTHASMPATSR